MEQVNTAAGQIDHRWITGAILPVFPTEMATYLSYRYKPDIARHHY